MAQIVPSEIRNACAPDRGLGVQRDPDGLVGLVEIDVSALTGPA
jgi:hypothetical protein